jgi:hypothetical protein
MTKKQPKRWMFSPPKPAKPTVSETLKAEVEAEARELIDTVLKPQHLKPPPKDQRWNYIIDMGAKWYRGYFYLFSTYACRPPSSRSSPAWSTSATTASTWPTCGTPASGGKSFRA